MKVTIDIKDDDVVVVIHRPEGYEGVHPQLVAEDFMVKEADYERPWLAHYDAEWNP